MRPLRPKIRYSRRSEFPCCPSKGCSRPPSRFVASACAFRSSPIQPALRHAGDRAVNDRLSWLLLLSGQPRTFRPAHHPHLSHPSFRRPAITTHESSLIIECMAISAASTKHTGVMIWRFMASATNAVRFVTPSLNIALVKRFLTVPASMPASRAISFEVNPWAKGPYKMHATALNALVEWGRVHEVRCSQPRLSGPLILFS